MRRIIREVEKMRQERSSSQRGVENEVKGWLGEINKAEVVELFDINSTREREDTIDYAVIAVLKQLFWALPMLIWHATSGATSELHSYT